jgi:hypothetical protein
MVLKLGHFGKKIINTGKFWNVVQEKDGEDHLDGLCKKRSSITKSKEGQEYPTTKKKKNED